MSAKRVIINGQEWSWPSDSVTTEDVREKGSITPLRNLFHVHEGRQTLMRPGTRIRLDDGDMFSDAPVPVKG